MQLFFFSFFLIEKNLVLDKRLYTVGDGGGRNWGKGEERMENCRAKIFLEHINIIPVCLCSSFFLVCLVVFDNYNLCIYITFTYQFTFCRFLRFFHLHIRLQFICFI